MVNILLCQSSLFLRTVSARAVRKIFVALQIYMQMHVIWSNNVRFVALHLNL